jgi:hypothetical protein
MGKFTERRFTRPRSTPQEARQHTEQVLRDALIVDEDIVFAYVFGSFARGEAYRDIDVALYTAQPRDALSTLDTAAHLERLTGCAVDVILIRHAPVALQYAILRDGHVLFSKDDTVRLCFLAMVSHQYRDYAHFRNIFLGVAGARSEQNY